MGFSRGQALIGGRIREVVGVCLVDVCYTVYNGRAEVLVGADYKEVRRFLEVGDQA
jgi:hypothetical protein